MLSRRRFMFLLGGATTGLWLASTGLVPLERTFVLSLAGSCAFCGKDRAATHALVGTAGCAHKICDECVALCVEIIGEEIGLESPARDASQMRLDNEAFQEHVGDVLKRLAEERASPRTDALMNDLRRALDPERRTVIDTFRCSFCDVHRRDVRKLISGPRVFICDTCVGEATAVVSHVLRVG